MKKLLLASVCAATMVLSMSTGVQAADMDSISPYDWSGVYIGGQIGYAFGNADHTFSNATPSDNSKPDGVLGGVHAGYLFQQDMIVFGIEADLEGTGVKGTFQNATGGTSSGSTDIDLQGSVRARLGYAMDRVLPYITGGIAIADVDYRGGPVGGPCCGYSKTAVGWTIGSGVQYAFTDMISGRIEYRYTDFGKKSGGLSPTFPTVTMPVDLETHAIRVGISVKLGNLFGS